MAEEHSSLSPRTLSGRDYRTGQALELRLEGEIISEVRVSEKAGADGGPFIGPGLVDLQVNGFRGIDLNGPDLTVEDVRKLTEELWSVGVTTFLPTVITNSPDRIRRALGVLREACERYPAVEASVGGIHLEGPFLSPEDGPRGAHPRAHVQPPDEGLLADFQAAAGGRIKLLTLSPEWPGAADFIRGCVGRGIIVAIGHTAASPEQIRAAAAAGARLSTHLGNAAHLQLPRHPNYLWEQLADDRLAATVIADGFHLPDAVLRVVFRVKGEQALLISDSVSLAGMPPGTYDSPIGDKVVLTEEGKLHLASNPGLLAGSAQPLLWGVQQVVQRRLLSLPEAWQKASVYPALFLSGRAAGTGLEEGEQADLVVFRWDGEKIMVEETFKRGRLVGKYLPLAPS